MTGKHLSLKISYNTTEHLNRKKKKLVSDFDFQ